jgi:plastocyanin
VSLRWTFDDGGSALGGSVTHAFAKAGRHRATVIATDLDGFSAGASVTVTVTGPSLTKLSLKPARFTAHAGTTIRYFDAQTAKTTFAVLRVRGRSAKVIGTFTHTDRAGKNAFHWSARIRRRPLAAGRYRLKAIPRNRAGAGAAVVVSFQVRRAPPGRNRHR